MTSGTTDLQTLVDSINMGTAARVTLNYDYLSAGSTLAEAFGIADSATNVHISVGDVKVGIYASGAAGAARLDSDVDVSFVTSVIVVEDFMETLTSAINTADGNVFAVWNGDSSGNAVMVFAKDAGTTGNTLQAQEDICAVGATFALVGDNVTTTSAVGGITGGTFSGGGENWVTASIDVDGDGNYHLQIAGNATGTGHDINFFEAANATGYGGGGISGASSWIGSLSSYDEASATEWVQANNASGSNA
ncbi:MAG: hypothetical protein JRJ73_07315, partial [Deltaproteobacteria bacterium]|nr:hypothetical protein [Deltaproteobacteria bacterium]